MNACLEFRNFCLLEFVLCLACWRLAVFMSACRDSSSGFHQDFAEFGCFNYKVQNCVADVHVCSQSWSSSIAESMLPQVL